MKGHIEQANGTLLDKTYKSPVEIAKTYVESIKCIKEAIECLDIPSEDGIDTALGGQAEAMREQLKKTRSIYNGQKDKLATCLNAHCGACCIMFGKQLLTSLLPEDSEEGDKLWPAALSGELDKAQEHEKRTLEEMSLMGAECSLVTKLCTAIQMEAKVDDIQRALVCFYSSWTSLHALTAWRNVKSEDHFFDAFTKVNSAVASFRAFVSIQRGTGEGGPSADLATKQLSDAEAQVAKAAPSMHTVCVCLS